VLPSLSFFKIITMGWQIFIQKPWRNFFLICLPYLVSLLILNLAATALPELTFTPKQILEAINTPEMARVALASLVTLVINVVLSTVSQLLSFRIIDTYFMDKDLDLLSFIKSKYLGLLLVNTLAYLIIIGGFILILPGIYFAYAFLFAGLNYLVMEEKGLTSLKQSKKFMKVYGPESVFMASLVLLFLVMVLLPLSSIPYVGQALNLAPATFWFYLSLYLLYFKGAKIEMINKQKHEKQKNSSSNNRRIG